MRGGRFRSRARACFLGGGGRFRLLLAQQRQTEPEARRRQLRRQPDAHARVKLGRKRHALELAGDDFEQRGLPFRHDRPAQAAVQDDAHGCGVAFEIANFEPEILDLGFLRDAMESCGRKREQRAGRQLGVGLIHSTSRDGTEPFVDGDEALVVRGGRGPQPVELPLGTQGAEEVALADRERQHLLKLHERAGRLIACEAERAEQQPRAEIVRELVEDRTKQLDALEPVTVAIRLDQPQPLGREWSQRRLSRSNRSVAWASRSAVHGPRSAGRSDGRRCMLGVQRATGDKQPSMDGFRRCIGPSGGPLNGCGAVGALGARGVRVRALRTGSLAPTPTTDKAAEARPPWPTGPRLRSTSAGPTYRPLSCRGPRSTSISSAGHRKAWASWAGCVGCGRQVHGRCATPPAERRAAVGAIHGSRVHGVRTRVRAATAEGSARSQRSSGATSESSHRAGCARGSNFVRRGLDRRDKLRAISSMRARA